MSCYRCGEKLDLGEATVALAHTADELVELASGIWNPKLRKRLITALELIDFDRARELRAELAPLED